MATVYSFMIKFEEGNVIEIVREAEEVSIPPTATRICEVACFFGSITFLNLENTQITIIEKHAFANCYNLKEVRFSSCLEEICEGAFKQCNNLIQISFPPDSRLRIIGRRAFESCSMMQKFKFPRCIEFIDDFSFEGCAKIEVFDLRETCIRHVGLINRGLYYYFSINLPPTVIQNNIIRISEDSKCHIEVDELHPEVQRDSCGYFFSNGTIFHGNKESRRVLIRHGVERITGRCFFGPSLVSVTIPSSVTEISDFAFYECRGLQHIRFTKNSRLRVIGEFSFYRCLSIKRILFPESLKIIKKQAFDDCHSLERIIFPQDSRLERIEGAFGGTSIKRLSLPPSVRKIVDVSDSMQKLESMFVSNEYYQSNEEGSAIFSEDGSELVYVINKLNNFEIPDSVRVIKKRAFYQSSITGRLIIPPSVEVIEEEAFHSCIYLNIIEFKEGSRLKSLAFDAFDGLEDLIINNENFVKMENGVVMSLDPRGIVFVPRELTELEIPPGVEVIYSHAFNFSIIKILKFPKSLKKICSWAFVSSSLESVTFEEGTELNFIGNSAFYDSSVKSLKLPPINGDLERDSLNFQTDFIEFPPKLNLKNEEIMLFAAEIFCPRSIISALAHFEFEEDPTIFIDDE